MLLRPEAGRRIKIRVIAGIIRQTNKMPATYHFKILECYHYVPSGKHFRTAQA